MSTAARRNAPASKASRLESLTIPDDARCDPAENLTPKQAQVYAAVMARGVDGVQVRDVARCDVAHVTTKRVLDYLVSLGLLQSRGERRSRQAAATYYPAGRPMPATRQHITPEALAILRYLAEHGPSTTPDMLRIGLNIQHGNGYYRVELLAACGLLRIKRTLGKASVLSITAAGRTEIEREQGGR